MGVGPSLPSHRPGHRPRSPAHKTPASPPPSGPPKLPRRLLHRNPLPPSPLRQNSRRRPLLKGSGIPRHRHPQPRPGGSDGGAGDAELWYRSDGHDAVARSPRPVRSMPVAPDARCANAVAPVPVMPAPAGYGVPAAPVAEDTQWYCWTNNQQYGPVTIDTLVEWAKAGRLTPKDHVKFGENGDWFEAGSVDELFSTPKKAAAGKGLAEVKVQSREEFQQEKADLVAANPVAEVKKDSEKPVQKFEPLFTKEMLKKATEKKSAAGGLQINLSKNAQLGILLSVLAVVGAVVYLPSAGINIGKLFGGGNSWEMGIYQKLRSHHTKLKDFRSKNDSAGWEKYAKGVESEIDGYRKSLEKSAGAKYPARQQLLFAVKDHWKAMISDSASKPGPGEEQFDKALSSARKMLQKK